MADDTHLGEVLFVSSSYAWVRPIGPLPTEIKAALSKMNTEIRAAAAERGHPFCNGVCDNVIWVALADIAEGELGCEVGTKILFKLYYDNDFVGGCEVTSA